ncbi:hypothetical protein BJ741DRAFT_710936 [Chytriomyces cf. hyalinus JEL632]|nr:hypothetical protein BJ741DRAFT_710936 [Chytriomyces cf. hyalinus JEL632]
MSSCQSAFARFGAVTQTAFGQGPSEAVFDGTYACQQQVMDALSDYQDACGKDRVRTLTGDYSDTQSLQSFCFQKKAVVLMIPGESGTLSAPTQVQSTSADPGFQFPTSITAAPPASSVPPIASSVPVGAGPVAAASNSIALYAGIGAGIAFVVIVAIVFFASQKRRKEQAALERLQMPYTYHSDAQKAYNMPSMPDYNLSATVPVPTPQPKVNLQYPAESIRSSESQYSSGKIPVPSSMGDEKSSTWNAAATPISALVSDEKRSMMNASYVPANSSNEKQRDHFPSDGSVALDMAAPQVSATLDPIEWSVSDVVAWARAIPHFGDKLGNIMLEFQINGRVLMGLTRDSMKEELRLVFGEVAQLEAGIAQLRGVQGEGLPPSYDA